MKKIVFATIYATLLINCGGVSAADKAYTFTIKGKAGMQFRAMLLPVECIKKAGKKVVEIQCPVAAVEPIVLAIGPPLTLTESEHTFDLVQGIKEYMEGVGSKNIYPISGYGGVCVHLQQSGKQSIHKCGPIGGSVNFN